MRAVAPRQAQRAGQWGEPRQAQGSSEPSGVIVVVEAVVEHSLRETHAGREGDACVRIEASARAAAVRVWGAAAIRGVRGRS